MANTVDMNSARTRSPLYKTLQLLLLGLAVLNTLHVADAANVCTGVTSERSSPRADNCALYTQCNVTSGLEHKECPYPSLFSTLTSSCEKFDTVQCGTRQIPQAPCDYQQYQCPKSNSTCTPCPQRMPSCVELSDGNQTFPGRKWREDYVTCFRNRTIGIHKCTSGFFHPKQQICVTDIDRDDSHDFCLANPKAMYPAPDDCAQFYNCSLAPGSKSVVKECTYPDLFSLETRTCLNFRDVHCQKRYEPQDPCDYEENRCKVITCVPCSDRQPSCVGLKDGRQPFMTRLWSPSFVQCFQNRTLKVETCVKGFFNPTVGQCVEQLQKEYAGEFCKENPYEIILVPGNCAQYYNCSLVFSDKGPDAVVQECHYPNVFSPKSRRCENVKDVNCTDRTHIAVSQPCQPSPCLNAGTCEAQFQRYKCTCTKGYTGLNCETDVRSLTTITSQKTTVNQKTQTTQLPSTQTRKTTETTTHTAHTTPVATRTTTTAIQSTLKTTTPTATTSTSATTTIKTTSTTPESTTTTTAAATSTTIRTTSTPRSTTPSSTTPSSTTPASTITTTQFITQSTVPYTNSTTVQTTMTTKSTSLPPVTTTERTTTIAATLTPPPTTATALDTTTAGCPYYPDDCPATSECSHLDSNNCRICDCNSTATKSGTPTCPQMMCLLDCGFPPAYKQDATGCDVCECGQEQRPGGSTCFVLDCHGNCGDPPRYKMDADGCPSCACAD